MIAISTISSDAYAVITVKVKLNDVLYSCVYYIIRYRWFRVKGILHKGMLECGPLPIDAVETVVKQVLFAIQC